MSSKDKMNVQDQSKERGVSGDLELSEEKESSPGNNSDWADTDHEFSNFSVNTRDCADDKLSSFSSLRKLHSV